MSADETTPLSLDPSSPLSRYFEAADAVDGPSPEQLQVLDGALASLLATPPPPPDLSSGASAASAGGPAATTTVAGGAGVAGSKLVLGVVAAAVATGGGLLAVTTLSGPDPVPPPIAIVRPAEPPPAPAPETPVEAEAPPAAIEVVEPPAPKPAPKRPTVKVAASAEGELELLQQALAAMRAGDGAAALKGAEAHQQRFPDGALAQEREMVAIEALMTLHRVDEAKARAQVFSRKWPTSPHQVRLDRLVGAE